MEHIASTFLRVYADVSPEWIQRYRTRLKRLMIVFEDADSCVHAFQRESLKRRKFTVFQLCLG